MVEVTIHCPNCGKEFRSLHKEYLSDGKGVVLPKHDIVRGVACPSTSAVLPPEVQQPFTYEPR